MPASRVTLVGDTLVGNAAPQNFPRGVVQLRMEKSIILLLQDFTPFSALFGKVF